MLFVIGRVIEGGGFGFVTLTTGSLMLTLVAENKRGFWSSVNIVAAIIGLFSMIASGIPYLYLHCTLWNIA